MTREDHRRILGLLADQIDRREPLTDDQLTFLSCVFRRIANGESSEVVLGIDRKVGLTDQQIKARMELSFIFHWIANAILPVDRDGLGWTTSRALQHAAERFEKDFQYLKNQWHKESNKHLRNPDRNPFDMDFPY